MESGTTTYSPEPEAVEVIFARILTVPWPVANRATSMQLFAPSPVTIRLPMPLTFTDTCPAACTDGAHAMLSPNPQARTATRRVTTL